MAFKAQRSDALLGDQKTAVRCSPAVEDVNKELEQSLLGEGAQGGVAPER